VMHKDRNPQVAILLVEVIRFLLCEVEMKWAGPC